ncbi:MAG: holin family protein [Pseudomonadota bacterium]
MGLIERLFTLVFGGGNVIRDTAEVFVENAEARAGREADYAQAALAQFAAEFAVPRRGWFDRTMDGINRIPRPAMALGTLGLFVAAMVDPIWFAARMEGIALVPQPLWWLLGAIVSFYFGARHQAKGQEYQRALATSLAQTRNAAREIAAREAVAAPNPALDDWRASR